uniref:Flap endonuclease 1 n=1 Tax=Hanusia phi TaxID=3032 RepID=A0A7S0EIY2_9CRYP|mmetsp:Transcript_25564/g.57509  ORF Transcript_25564/g.57509 Transcript_25564/m.57509 type:complete len:391 (+) Transcript_25564:1-1173(+)
MGIKGLTKVIGDNASEAMKEVEIGSYFGRKVAIDASMSIYQFLIAMQRPDGQAMLTNDAGEVTSHINGLLMRTTKMLECGIKPLYVFDGKPPELKKETLEERKERREESEAALAKAKEEGDEEAVEKFAKRTVRVSKEMTEDAKQLLRLMGVPVIEAPTEAEAQCAALARAGVVYAAVSEDMDTLTFGAPIMLRNLFVPESRKLPILEINLSKVLEGLSMNMDQFIDLCILLGCDYCGTIKGAGPKTSISWIEKYKSIASVVKNIDISKHPLPEPFNHEEIHSFFQQPEITDPKELEAQGLLVWKEPNYEELREFLVTRFQFNKERIEHVLTRLKKTRGTNTQQRMDSFFTKMPSSSPAGTKRPAAKDAKGKDAKKAKGGGGKPGPKKGR